MATLEPIPDHIPPDGYTHILSFQIDKDNICCRRPRIIWVDDSPSICKSCGTRFVRADEEYVKYYDADCIKRYENKPVCCNKQLIRWYRSQPQLCWNCGKDFEKESIKNEDTVILVNKNNG